MEKRIIVTEFGEVTLEVVDFADGKPTQCATNGTNCTFFGALSYEGNIYAGVHIHNEKEFHICFIHRYNLEALYESDGKRRVLFFQGPYERLLEAISASIQEYQRWLQNEVNAEELDRARGYADISPLAQADEILKR